MHSMIISQQQLIRRSINSMNNNNNESNDVKSDANECPTSQESETNDQINVVQSSDAVSDSNDLNTCLNTTSSETRRAGDKTKKKRSNNSWLNILNPTYKTRHQEFKRLFADLVPNNERLVVDYSCALQKEILVHGRLYLSLNYISFYANIFKWETSLVIKCQDITSLTKTNTARVIPNAIQVVTNSGDKYVFTSFAARDKTYVMLFRIWQNALLNQPMSSAQLWQWVHYSYGEDLGLTSDDDEEYYSDHLVQTLSSLSQPTEVDVSESNASDLDSSLEKEIITDSIDAKVGSSDCKCGSHNGKLVMDQIFPVAIDRAFELLFTDNKFIHNLHKSRRTNDLSVSQWDDSPKEKKRQMNYTVALNHPLVKSARTNEIQELLEESIPGQSYSIKSEAANEGVPYCDTFTTKSLWCLSKESEEMTRIVVHSEVIFKKNVWGLSLMKSIIEKSSIQGITDYCTDLSKQLPNWLQMERNLGLDPNLSFNTISEDNKTTELSDSCDSSFMDSTLKQTKVIPLVPKYRFRLHPIIKTFSSLNDKTLMKIILIILSISLILNLMILFRIWKMESTNELNSNQSQTGLTNDSIKRLIDSTIQMINNIESNLVKLKNRFRDEL